MYPVSEAYKNAIAQNERNVRIIGTITLKDGTVIEIDDEDIVQGSLYVSEQCVSGEDIEIGNVYASEMGLTLTTPPENPYSLDGARIILNFGIETSEGVWEYVPLGYFYVTEIERKATVVNLKALDGMILFDVDISGVQTSGTPYEIVSSCCAKAGITLATDLTTFNTFANAGTTFVLPEENSVKTCRDLLMWVCQLTGTFARMNRMGQLEIIPITGRAPVKTISKDERFTSDVSDFFIKVAQVTMKVGETEYSQGTDGMTMVLEENPLLTGKSEAEINAALSNILNQVTLAEYTPSNVDFPGDPSLQAGDYVTLTDAGILDSEVETGTYFLSPAFPASIEVRRNIATSMITHHTWRYRGKHNLKSAGKSSLIQVTQSQQSKAVAAIQAIAKTAQEIAKAANQSTQLINDAIGGHVLIRREPGGTNEILIMDNEDPDQATKIWRWNMGGLGYSDNVIGVDNPARQYEVAMTMDGAINANFIKTGKIAAQYITVGPETVFADGYDPTAIQIGGRNLIIRHNEVPDTMIGEDGVSAPLVGSSMVNDFIPVQPGDTLTFSQIIQDGTGDDYFRCAFYTDPLDNASYVVRRISSNATVFTETVPEGAYWLRVSYATKNKVQLEKGNKATDWTPAPEDVEAYAEHKAAEAQAAAEAVAKAEAELAQVNAEAYADGKVSAEEQARIDQAAANLAEAKAHAETKAAEAEQAAKAYAETQIDNHDANPSPHNLPSYVKMQGDGFKVFDGSNRLRAHLGQYLAGLFGLALYNIYGDRVFEADDDGNLKIVGDFVTYAGGQKALEMVGQILKVYDWEGTERAEPVGQLYSGRIDRDPAKPGVVLANKKNAILALDYEEGDTFYNYVTFDKDKITGQEEPIKFTKNIYVGDGYRLRFANTYLIGNVAKGVNIKDTGGTTLADFTFNYSSGWDIYFYRNTLCARNVHVYGNFNVGGAKNALHQTEHYGERQISAYETAEYYFGDIGSGTINQDGECIVYIDDIFSECVNTDIEYHVFTQVYNGAITSIDRQKTYFTVYGTPETEFSWELKAKRRGYEYCRLEVPDNSPSVDVANFDDCICDNEVVVDMLEKEITYNLTDYLLS